MRRSYYKANQEIGHFTCGWRFSIVELVYKSMNTKKRVLLQLMPHVLQVVIVWIICVRVVS